MSRVRGLSAPPLSTVHHPELPEPWNSFTLPALTQASSSESKCITPPPPSILLCLILSSHLSYAPSQSHNLSRLTASHEILLCSEQISVLNRTLCNKVRCPEIDICIIIIIYYFTCHQRFLLSLSCLLHKPRSCLLHIQGILFCMRVSLCAPCCDAQEGVGGCPACGSPCLVQRHPTGRAFNTHYFHLNQHSSFFHSSLPCCWAEWR